MRSSASRNKRQCGEGYVRKKTVEEKKLESERALLWR